MTAFVDKGVKWFEAVIPVCVLVVVLAVMLVMFSGCKAPGSVTLLGWDSRSPEQLAAAVPIDTAVYARNGAGAKQESRAFTEWKALFDMISGLRVSIFVGQIRWGETK